MPYTPLPEDVHIYQWKNGGGLVLDWFPPTVQQLQATIGPTPVVYRVEDAHTYRWRNPPRQSD